LRRRGQIGQATTRTVFAKIAARLGVLLTVLALLSQGLAAAAPPRNAPHDASAAAVELRALLGANFVICTQDDGSGAPTTPPHSCDDCPLCRLAAGAVALDTPAAVEIAAPTPVLESKLAFPQPPPLTAPAPRPSPLPRGPPSPT
jgi:hypothetical protein